MNNIFKPKEDYPWVWKETISYQKTTRKQWIYWRYYWIMEFCLLQPIRKKVYRFLKRKGFITSNYGTGIVYRVVRWFFEGLGKLLRLI